MSISQDTVVDHIDGRHIVFIVLPTDLQKRELPALECRCDMWSYQWQNVTGLLNTIVISVVDDASTTNQLQRITPIIILDNSWFHWICIFICW